MDRKKIAKIFGGLLLLASCGQQGGEAPSMALAGQAPPDGQKLYGLYCTACHGTDGKAGLGGAKDLASSSMDRPGVVKIIAQGSENKKMMAYGKLLSAEDIEALADYVLALRR
jgi:cytochrome c6